MYLTAGLHCSVQNLPDTTSTPMGDRCLTLKQLANRKVILHGRRGSA
jgi:hypothetical protein